MICPPFLASFLYPPSQVPATLASFLFLQDAEFPSTPGLSQGQAANSSPPSWSRLLPSPLQAGDHPVFPPEKPSFRLSPYLCSASTLGQPWTVLCSALSPTSRPSVNGACWESDGGIGGGLFSSSPGAEMTEEEELAPSGLPGGQEGQAQAVATSWDMGDPPSGMRGPTQGTWETPAPCGSQALPGTFQGAVPSREPLLLGPGHPGISCPASLPEARPQPCGPAPSSSARGVSTQPEPRYF